MKPFLRLATLDDAPQLARLHRDCFDEPWDAAAFTALLQRPGCFAMMAGESETELQALILVQRASGEAEVQSLGTLPSARRKGLADALVHAAMRECQKGHVAEIFLEVSADNAPALAFYTREGFRLVGLRKGYYRRVGAAAVDAVILRKPLPLLST